MEPQEEDDVIPTEGPFQCEICFEVSESKPDFVDHIKSFHIHVVDKSVLESLESQVRDEFLKSDLKTSLYKRKKSKDFIIKRDFLYCHQCSYYTDRSYTYLNRHFKSVHLNIQIKCNECEYKCKKPETLGDHKRLCHGDSELKCKFETCKMSFKTYAALGEHKSMVHDGISYSCKECEKYFSRNSTLKKHINYKHLKIPRPHLPQNFRCTLCSFKSCKESTLDKHIENFHVNKISFKCDECEFEFKHRKSLTRHKRLNKHIKSSDVKKTIYNCDSCEVFYEHRNSLARHKRLSHTNKK